MGGLLARNGKILPGYPKVQIFDRTQELEQLLTIAMDLEKAICGLWSDLSKNANGNIYERNTIFSERTKGLF